MRELPSSPFEWNGLVLGVLYNEVDSELQQTIIRSILSMSVRLDAQ